jgi:hypothetical protein
MKPRGTSIVSAPSVWTNSLSHAAGTLLNGGSTPILRRDDCSGRRVGYFLFISEFVLPRFKLNRVRGTGPLDNYLGMRLARYKWLHLIDYFTSWA